MKKFTCSLLLLCLSFGSLISESSCAELPKLKDLNPFSKDKDEEEDADFDLNNLQSKVKTLKVRDYTSVAGYQKVLIYGTGLVMGLDGTGEDPPSSIARTSLVEEMRKMDVKNPNTILRSPNTAMVEVIGVLPPLVRKDDPLDIMVRLPAGSRATSLSGGWLMPTRLAEQLQVKQEIKTGSTKATATGPILITARNAESENNASLLKKGVILAGGVSKVERNLTLFLRNEYASVRMTKQIADKIGERFYAYDEYGLQESMAKGKTDQEIELKLMPQYKHNHDRYIQVVRQISFREKPIDLQVRMTKLKEKIKNPATAEAAAIELEAIGHKGSSVLKSALNHENLEVQFHAAVALAYMGETEGLPVLVKAVKEEPAFRIYAFAAMAAIDDVEANSFLRDLINDPQADDNEVRYGAFRALTTLDKNDPFVRPVAGNKNFKLHVLDTPGKEMVHLTTHNRQEIVLFGAAQKLQTPLVMRAGLHILLSAEAGSDTITIGNYGPMGNRKSGHEREVSTNLEEVIRAVIAEGATYPDVAQMLTEAQPYLTGELAIDALPKKGIPYHRPSSVAGGRKVKTKVGGGIVPNIFSAAPQAGKTDDKDQPQVRKKPRSEEDASEEPTIQQTSGTSFFKLPQFLKREE